MNASAENSLSHLNSREVRDLAWSCFSAPLLISTKLSGDGSSQNAGLALTQERINWLHALDAKPQPLLDHLAKSRTTRLGLYFERLWHFFLSQDPEVTLLAHNLPVRNATRTLGEFDCVYYCHQRQRSVHLELAVKFYLSAPQATSSEQRHWLGPASQDRLDLKLQRMLDHQIRLADTPEGSAVLLELGVDDSLREIEIKGRLFTHWQHHTPPPPGYNNELALSHWYRVSELNCLGGNTETRYLPLERSQWLASVAGNSFETMTRTELIKHMTAMSGGNSRPAQIAVFDQNQREKQRLFLVPDNWPINNA